MGVDCSIILVVQLFHQHELHYIGSYLSQDLVGETQHLNDKITIFVYNSSTEFTNNLFLPRVDKIKGWIEDVSLFLESPKKWEH